MKHRRAVAVDPLDVVHAKVREVQPSWQRDDDLPRGSARRGSRGTRRGSVARCPESDREAPRGSRSGSASRSGRASVSPVRLRIDADDLHPPAAQHDLGRLVPEQGDTFECAPIAAGSTRCENGSRLSAKSWFLSTMKHGPSLSQKPLEQGRPGCSRHEVAGDTDDIRATFDHPGNGVLDCTPAARRVAESEVGQMGDAEAVQLGRHAFEPRSRAPGGVASQPRTIPTQAGQERRGRRSGRSRAARSRHLAKQQAVTWLARPAARRSDGQLLGHGLYGHDVALELEPGSSSPAATPMSCER